MIFSYEQLQVIHKVAERLSSPGDIRKVLHDILEILAKNAGMNRGMICVYQKDTKEIHLDVSLDLEEKKLDAIKYYIGEGVTGRVVETGRPIAVPSLIEAPFFLDRSKIRSHLDRSKLAFICVPVKYGDEVVGTLSVDHASCRGEDLQKEVTFLEEIAKLIASRVQHRRITEENIRLREMITHHNPMGFIIGNSDEMRNIAMLVSQVADSKTTILITGETGTGKGLIASEIHKSSPRNKGPFIKVNCGAIPENLVESELFGHEKGAFTGAVERRIGSFEAANGGTIFLDEIGELPAAAQVKLLNVIQEKEIKRVGGTKSIPVNVRIIAATNRDLQEEVDAGKFRADLFYRINVFPIHIPPLRERGSDTLLLVDFFINKYAKELNKNVGRIDTPAIDMIMAYHWPGNVRELENCIERGVLLSSDGVIHAHHLPPTLQIKPFNERNKPRGRFETLVETYEKELITDALKDSHGNQSMAAKLLGTTKRVIQYKVQQYDIDYKRFRLTKQNVNGLRS